MAARKRFVRRGGAGDELRPDDAHHDRTRTGGVAVSGWRRGERSEQGTAGEQEMP